MGHIRRVVCGMYDLLLCYIWIRVRDDTYFGKKLVYVHNFSKGCLVLFRSDREYETSRSADG
jgi:hypothetical protein